MLGGVGAGSHVVCDYAASMPSPLSARLSLFGAFALRLRYGAPTSLAALSLGVFAYGVPLIPSMWITT